MAPVVRKLRKHSGQVEPPVCVTARHREMLDQVLLFAIVPDYDLKVLEESQNACIGSPSSTGPSGDVSNPTGSTSRGRLLLWLRRRWLRTHCKWRPS